MGQTEVQQEEEYELSVVLRVSIALAFQTQYSPLYES